MSLGVDYRGEHSGEGIIRHHHAAHRGNGKRRLRRTENERKAKEMIVFTGLELTVVNHDLLFSEACYLS